MQKVIHITGMHSGQNPASGVGIARCLRQAFPSLKLVGVDHWQGSSGLHDGSVDEALLLPPWNQIDDDRHSEQVRALLDSGNLWISALDMEVRWFAENFGRHENLLAPGEKAVELTAKPAVTAIEALDFRVPEYIPISLADSEIHTFLRHSSWQCWLKSPFHDAKQISSWGAFVRARDAMSKSWRTSRLFLQRHVIGNEETIAFTAYQGELLGAARLEKRLITPGGKTWAGRVSAPDPEFMSAFKEIVRRLEWSGGGELEYVRDPDGQKWIIECNPRFPAWIYGGALAGINLPAKLISHVWQLPYEDRTARFPCFTRVVQEIPVRESIGLPLPPDPTTLIWASDGKKGKDGPSFAALLPKISEEDEEQDEQAPEEISLPFFQEVERVTREFQGESPSRIHLEEWSLSRFESLASKARASRDGDGPEVRIGYSVKTSPTDAHLKKAKDRGFYAECISQMEVRRAIQFGFRPHEVILNGPGKFWPLTSPPVTGLHMLFCDSIEEFERVIEIPGIARCLGFRMRHPKLHSRFGNPLDDFGNFQKIVAATRRIQGKAELGFHFHMPSWAVGVERWTEALHSLLTWCQTVERLSGVPVRHLDLGGGFFPTDLERLDFTAIQELVSKELPQVDAIYFEPGRSLTQDGEVLVSRVLDVRKDSDGDPSEIVVDACIAELPLAAAFSHRIFYHAPSGAEPTRLLDKGPTRILGRICMEDDILSPGVSFPQTLAIGDLVVFGDAGGYERTMSYDFGRG